MPPAGNASRQPPATAALDDRGGGRGRREGGEGSAGGHLAAGANQTKRPAFLPAATDDVTVGAGPLRPPAPHHCWSRRRRPRPHSGVVGSVRWCRHLGGGDRGSRRRRHWGFRRRTRLACQLPITKDLAWTPSNCQPIRLFFSAQCQLQLASSGPSLLAVPATAIHPKQPLTDASVYTGAGRAIGDITFTSIYSAAGMREGSVFCFRVSEVQNR